MRAAGGRGEQRSNVKAEGAAGRGRECHAQKHLFLLCLQMLIHRIRARSTRLQSHYELGYTAQSLSAHSHFILPHTRDVRRAREGLFPSWCSSHLFLIWTLAPLVQHMHP